VATPPLDVCFMLARMGADRILIVMTPWNYPAAAPKARVAPFMPIKEDQDLGEFFELMWADSDPLDDPPDWTWDESRMLVDYVRALETALGIEGSPADEPDEDTISEAQS
jgi:hypothetical protein